MKSRLQVAKLIARQQYEMDEGVEAIYLVKTGATPRNGKEPIVLLQVNREGVAAGVLPLGFSAEPDNGIPFPYVIVDITPEEFGSLQESLANHQPVKGWRVGWEVGQKLNPLATT
jgi:hypothetical protein